MSTLDTGKTPLRWRSKKQHQAFAFAFYGLAVERTKSGGLVTDLSWMRRIVVSTLRMTPVLWKEDEDVRD